MSERGHPLFARLYDPVMAGAERTVLVDHREFLAADLSGHVLDLGAGTGAMFPYFDGAAVELDAVEPDPHMRKRARERARSQGLAVTIADAAAEELPFEDGRFDAVVASLVFCTVSDPSAALDEIARVLRPGGTFRFLEHVRGEGLAGRFHDAAAPAWHAVAGGCHLNRETGALFLDDDRFATEAFERFDGRVGLHPMIRGRLRRAPDAPAGLDRLFDLVGDSVPGL